jgi:TonB family protein
LATQAAPQPDTPAPALDAAPPELPEAPNVVPAKTAEVPAVGQPQPAAERAQSCAAPTPTPIEPPTFWQLQDDVSCSEKADYAECRTEPELLSILNPAPAADPPNTNIAGMIAGIVGACAALMAVLSHSSHPASRFSPPAVVFSPASTTAERVYRAGDSVTPPLLLSKAEPEYTREAFQAQLQGTVALYAQIDPSGNAVNLHVLRGLGMGLDARAIEAASKWRFQPGMKNGTPVTFETNLEVNFRLP